MTYTDPDLLELAGLPDFYRMLQDSRSADTGRGPWITAGAADGSSRFRRSVTAWSDSPGTRHPGRIGRAVGIAGVVAEGIQFGATVGSAMTAERHGDYESADRLMGQAGTQTAQAVTEALAVGLARRLALKAGVSLGIGASAYFGAALAVTIYVGRYGGYSTEWHREHGSRLVPSTFGARARREPVTLESRSGRHSFAGLPYPLVGRFSEGKRWVGGDGQREPLSLWLEPLKEDLRDVRTVAGIVAHPGPFVSGLAQWTGRHLAGDPLRDARLASLRQDRLGARPQDPLGPTHELRGRFGGPRVGAPPHSRPPLSPRSAALHEDRLGARGPRDAVALGYEQHGRFGGLGSSSLLSDGSRVIEVAPSSSQRGLPTHSSYASGPRALAVVQRGHHGSRVRGRLSSPRRDRLTPTRGHDPARGRAEAIAFARSRGRLWQPPTAPTGGWGCAGGHALAWRPQPDSGKDDVEHGYAQKATRNTLPGYSRQLLM